MCVCVCTCGVIIVAVLLLCPIKIPCPDARARARIIIVPIIIVRLNVASAFPQRRRRRRRHHCVSSDARSEEWGTGGPNTIQPLPLRPALHLLVLRKTTQHWGHTIYTIHIYLASACCARVTRPIKPSILVLMLHVTLASVSSVRALRCL